MGSKNITIIGGSFLLVAAVVACAIAVIASKNANDNAVAVDQPKPTPASIKAVQSFCSPTPYKETCEAELTKVAGNSTDLKSLVKSSITAAFNNLETALKHSTLLDAAAKDPRTSSDLKTCGELFDYAKDDLHTSLDRVDNYELTHMDKVFDDLKTWISAVVTYQEMCLDTFANSTGETAESMRQALNSSMELTSNLLEIFDDVATIIGEFKLPSILDGGRGGRRLMSNDDEFQPWTGGIQRSLLQQQAPWELKPTVTVAQDGSGQYKTITEGLNAMPKKSAEYVVMQVKAGVYNEMVVVDRNLTNLVMVGDGPTTTRITGHLSVMLDNINTFKTATIAIIGNNFIAKDMGFENSAGPEGHQAVAVRIQSDKSVFYNCHFDGYQDTLYAVAHRHFFRDCTISGTVDFIFGDGKSYFQNSTMLVRKPMDNQQNIITAHGRKDEREDTGIVFHKCSIVPDPALAPVAQNFRTYLARPWKAFSRTIIISSQIDAFIHPDGFMPWIVDNKPTNIDTCHYAEIDNFGPGADKSKRVNWSGVKILDGTPEVGSYTVTKFMSTYENDWLGKTTVPVVPGFDFSSPNGNKKRGGHQRRGKRHAKTTTI